MDERDEMLADLGTEPDLKGRSYHCNKCYHRWFYIEPNPGDVPGACPNCFDMNFDGAYKASH
jgi:hypothetical protein